MFLYKKQELPKSGIRLMWFMNKPRLQVKEGGYDYKMNETVNVVTAKTTEIGHRTWGIMKGVMAMASQKVEEYTKDGWNTDNWQQNNSQSNGYYQEFNKQENKGWNSSSSGQSSSGHYNSCSSSSWDDWDRKDNRKEDSVKSTALHSNDGWAGWDDAKDDGYDDNFYHSAPDKKSASHNGKSDASWTGGGFFRYVLNSNFFLMFFSSGML